MSRSTLIQNLLPCKTDKWFSQVFINFGRIWLAEPDYKCKIRNTRNEAQWSKCSRNKTRDISVNKKLNAEKEGINGGLSRKYARKKPKVFVRVNYMYMCVHLTRTNSSLDMLFLTIDLMVTVLDCNYNLAI